MSDAFIELAMERILGLKKSKVVMWKVNGRYLTDVKNVFHQTREEDQELFDYYLPLIKGDFMMPILDKARIIMKAVNSRVRYVKDIDLYKRIEYWARPIDVHRQKRDDCFTGDTTLLLSNGDLISIEYLEVGDEIIGAKGQPTEVINKSYKGIKKTLKFHLNNGSMIEVTPEHTFSHCKNNLKTKDQKWTDKKASEIRVGDQLESCKDIQFGNEISLTYDLGYIFGLYLADGWTREKHQPNSKTIYIAGKDGHKKEEQKEFVKNFCKKRNIPFFNRKRYCYFQSFEILHLIKCYFGNSGAKDKFIKHHSFSIEGTRGLLDGLKADACERETDLTYSTINKSLAIAIRIWLRRIGKQCSIKLVTEHGGFGKNPIYRIGVRREKPRRIIVKAIEEGEDRETYNITTTSGKVYLPEQDTIIRQCDGYAVLMCYVMRLLGASPWEVWTWAGDVYTDGMTPENSKAFGHANCQVWDKHTSNVYTMEGSVYPKRAESFLGKVRTKDNPTYGRTWFVTNDIRSYTDSIFGFKFVRSK